MTPERRQRAAVRTKVAHVARDARPPHAVASWLPSLRSLFVAGAILVAGAGAYVLARETSVFAIREIEVTGVPPAAAARVERALEPVAGSSLVAFDGTAGDRRLVNVPFVAAATYDRDFPHTLRVVVLPERPIAVIRRGADAWVAAASGRVLRKVEPSSAPDFPRVWLAPTADPLVGSVLADPSVAAVRALLPMSGVRLPVPIRTVKLVDGELSIVLDTETEVLLGDAERLRLKLAVVARVLALAGDAKYIDASVPERVVAGSTSMTNPQVEE